MGRSRMCGQFVCAPVKSADLYSACSVLRARLLHFPFLTCRNQREAAARCRDTTVAAGAGESIDARRLLDGMPPEQPAKRAIPPVAGGGGSIEFLPDGVLEHILGFLLSAEAVQTSVLARRWRNLWKSATGLRIGRPLDEDPMSVEELRSLVNHLLVLRQGSPLDTCEFTIGGFSGGDDVRHVNLWFRQAVMCRARMLRICIHSDIPSDPWLELDNLPLVSEHLTRLELHGVMVQCRLVNFSRCPALEHLEIDCCDLSLVTKISSHSVKYLSINDSVLSSDFHIHIYAPNLVSLHLDCIGETPILYSMPSLVEAIVTIYDEFTDHCNGTNSETCDCEACDNSDNMAASSSTSALLKGVSEAKNLVLISRSNTFIFKRILRWCPMFQKLKTLLLNDYWCVPDDFCALACILEHSPVLEKLTLELYQERPQPKVEMKLCVSSTKRSAAISECLKKVELKCEVVDDSVLKVLKFLSTYNICKLTGNAPCALSLLENYEWQDLECQVRDKFELCVVWNMDILLTDNINVSEH